MNREAPKRDGASSRGMNTQKKCLVYSSLVAGCDKHMTSCACGCSVEFNNSDMGRYIAGGRRPTFTCPNCQALYEVVKVEAGPETTLQEVTCLSCGGPLAAREGKFVLKYFLLREASRVQKSRRRMARK